MMDETDDRLDLQPPDAGEPAPTAAPPAPAKPKRYRRPFPWSGVLEGLLVVCLLVAAGLALTAGKPPSDEVAGQSPAGLFFRRVILGQLTTNAADDTGRVLPYWLLLAGVGGLLLLQGLLPRVRAEVRAASAAFGLVLLLAPVLNYGPQIDRLVRLPEDAAMLAGQTVAQITADRAYHLFDPRLPVTWPLLAAALLTVAWAVATPRAEWSAPFVAFGGVTLLLLGGGTWLVHALLAARGHAKQLDYLYWPMAVASLWVLGQLLVAACAAAAAGRQRGGSRALALLTACCLVATAALTRGAP